MTAARCPTCLGHTYQLRDPHGHTLTLDAAASPLGIWQPQPDGQTCRKLDAAELHRGRLGHARHDCPPSARTEQPTLFEGTS